LPIQEIYEPLKSLLFHKLTMRCAVATVLALTVAVCADSSQGSAASASQSTTVSAGQSSGSAAGSAAQASATAVVSPCVLNCLTAAANTTECGSPTNLTCSCTNTDFQSKAISCLQAECKPEELAAALGLQKQQCGSSAGSSGSPSATPGSALSLFAPPGAKGLMFALGIAVLSGVVGAVVV
ncbi:hypothetical protein B0H14DRAFT_2958045, partial [Mycena olivaceomarginata]